MKELLESLGLKNRALAWTVFYVFLMWVILYFLFNFNMFVATDWIRLTRIELHGFPGLVFGVMILAAMPLYIATTVLTVRNKEMPIKLPLPNCLTPVPEKKEEVAQPKPVVVEQEILPELRPGVPLEMRESVMRAQKNYGARQMSVFNKPMTMQAIDLPNKTPVPEMATVPATTEEGGEVVQDNPFPVPNDFDIGGEEEKDYGVPVFSDINFDDENSENEQGASPTDDLCEFLTGAGYTVNKTDDDLIMVNNFVIAAHDDEDFWVADDVDWFAAGKQKPSPIAALNNARAANADLHPVLYFGKYNIMDFDEMAEKWRADGIDVITNRDDLLKKISE